MSEGYEVPERLIFIQSRVETDRNLVAEYDEMMEADIGSDAVQGISVTTTG